ncbi:MAG: hypothetical protein ACREQM_20065 [Candidatus Dormibacteraceae bacterium]
MRAAATVLLSLILVGGLVQLALGLGAWAGPAVALVPVHMLLGTVLVLTLWALSALGLVARVPLGMSVAGFVLGAAVLVYGMAQESVLTGSVHWIAQVLHLLLGLALIGLGLRLGLLVRGRARGRVARAA